jgi:hypothetical protein
MAFLLRLFSQLSAQIASILTRELIPAIARCGGKLLFVGCRRSTEHYLTLFGVRGAECWTIDNDTTVARANHPDPRRSR